MDNMRLTIVCWYLNGIMRMYCLTKCLFFIWSRICILFNTDNWCCSLLFNKCRYSFLDHRSSRRR